MRHFIIFASFLILVIAGTATNAKAQCGDANGDGSANIQDLIEIFNYISGAPSLDFNLANADCDGVMGVTISDAVAISHNLFDMIPLNCNVSGAYSYAAAPNDTIFMPRLFSIPDGVDTVNLLIYASLSEAAGGYFLPYLKAGTGSNAVFVLSYILTSDAVLGSNTSYLPDTNVLLGVDYLNAGNFVGSKTLALLRYVRVAAGNGDIVPEAVDRSSLLRVALERNGDLVVPVVAYYDAALPAGNLISASPSTLDLHATVNTTSADTVIVNFDNAGQQLDFTLYRSASWIKIDGYVNSSTVFSTPASLAITADPTGMGVLDYTGTIRMYYAGIYQPFDSIMVNFQVHPESNQTYPYGDLNCDGYVNVSDVLYLVYYLFAGGPEPFPCQ